jgi:small redox-active disulfide protein 2
MKIEILGSGCARCKQLEANVKKALEETKKKAEIIKVTDIDEIISRGIMATPAIIIDGKVKAFGRVPDVDEIKDWLQKP